MARLSWATALLLLGIVRFVVSANEPKLEFTQGMGNNDFVYVVWRGAYGTRPEMFRRRGGISFLDGPEDTSLDRSYTFDGPLSFRNWFHVSTDLANTISSLTSPEETGWHVYRISPSMNMVPIDDPPYGYTHQALGGIMWTQVHSVLWVTGYEATIAENAPWRNNPDYDPRWSRFGLGLPQPLLSFQSPLRGGESRRDRALRFMDFLVGEENEALAPDLRRTLDNLFDWTARRRFPLFRPGGDEELCRTVVRLIRALGGAVAAGVARGSTMKRENEQSCDALADFAQKNQSIETGTEKQMATFTGLDDLMIVNEPHIKICKDNDLKGPCVDVPVPRGKCVAIPEDMMGEVSSLRPNAAAGRCHVYRGPWEWSTKMQRQHCHRIDSLEFWLKLARGTLDSLHVSFKDCPEPGETHELTDTRRRNFGMWHKIDLQKFFGEPTPELSRVTELYLWGLVSRTNYVFGSTDFKLGGIQLSAHCADSNFTVRWQEHKTMDQTLHVGDEFYTASRNKLYNLWQNSISPQEWKGNPPCSHFSQMSVTLEIGNLVWAGSVNDIYVNIGKASTWIIGDPKRKDVRTVEIDLQEAFEKKLVALDDLKELRIQNWGGGDDVHVQNIVVRATCAGGSKKSVYYDKKIEEWIGGRGGEWHLALPPEVWIEY
ncbi:hypothetical protein CDD80_2135 [Ophiocordyceps camponoti-rufipedis]|uniref:Enterotoxin n=1 Tax=Ophiocordyceps camponoti-rufipedis TaxID=2004952 RepID=A0A2C5ZLL1_9HYPO|nr:hypothetical protein CDD80_2135 [Ophiocordyceps camponoti-rufipedis]